MLFYIYDGPHQQIFYQKVGILKTLVLYDLELHSTPCPEYTNFKILLRYLKSLKINVVVKFVDIGEAVV